MQLVNAATSPAQQRAKGSFSLPHSHFPTPRDMYTKCKGHSISRPAEGEGSFLVNISRKSTLKKKERKKLLDSKAEFVTYFESRELNLILLWQNPGVSSLTLQKEEVDIKTR